MFERPVNVERRVLPENGTLAGRIVGIGSFVEDFSGFREDEKAVCKALRDPKEFKFSLIIAGLQVKTGPLAEVRGIAAEVDGNVPDMAGEYADKLALGFTKLIMEAAEDSLHREGLIVLDKRRRETSRGKDGRIKYFGEPTATIPKTPGLK